MRRFTVEYYIIRAWERVNKSATVVAKADRGIYILSITEHRR